jgi:hypothetical protein
MIFFLFLTLLLFVVDDEDDDDDDDDAVAEGVTHNKVVRRKVAPLPLLLLLFREEIRVA